jgi:signal transduction histidine kinase
MRSSSEPLHGHSASTEHALLEKIEALSFLRVLNDRMASAADFPAACRALVDLVWEERCADAVAYLSVDHERRTCRVEAVAPAGLGGVGAEVPFSAPPLAALVAERGEPVLLRDGVPPPVFGRGTSTALPPGALVSVATRLRSTTAGLLVVWTHGEPARLEEDRRLLAITAASAAVALDAARGQAREDFLATLRHDINNPVAVAMGYTEMLAERLETMGDPELHQRALSVLELLKVIADLVSNYLHMPAIDRGAPSPCWEDLDLAALTADILDQLAPTAAEKRIVLARSGTCPRIRGDHRLLGRVVTNLIGNALKYTPGPGRVEVAFASDAEGVSLAVADTGYGIAPHHLERLFTKYARFHADKGIPGTGLGLYISRAIAEAHGGTLTVDTAVGRGSTFTLRLPHRAA